MERFGVNLSVRVQKGKVIYEIVNKLRHTRSLLDKRRTKPKRRLFLKRNSEIGCTLEKSPPKYLKFLPEERTTNESARTATEALKLKSHKTTADGRHKKHKLASRQLLSDFLAILRRK
jgi:hypothetical protein